MNDNYFKIAEERINNTNQSNPANDPFQVSSTDEVQLKAGQYLNADVLYTFTTLPLSE